MIKFPLKYPEEEEEELKKAAELFYEMGKAEIAEVATHLAKQFLYTYSSHYQAGSVRQYEKQCVPARLLRWWGCRQDIAGAA